MRYLALFATGSGLLVVGIVLAVVGGGTPHLQILGIALMIVGTVLNGVNIGMQMAQRRRDRV